MACNYTHPHVYVASCLGNLDTAMLGQISCVVTAWKGYLLGQLGHCLERLLVGATWTLLGQVFCWMLLGLGVTWMLLGQV